MRLNKYIAHSGVCSRRDAERYIADKRVMVNGVLADSPAYLVESGDTVVVDGELLVSLADPRLWLFHKPVGIITSHKDPQGRQSVFDMLPADLGYVISVGRLDFNTEGLLLLTNNGDLSRHLELPSTGWVRRYRVRVYGRVDETKLASLAGGSIVDGVQYGAVDVTVERKGAGNSWLLVSLKEGKNREVRKILESCGLKVNRLIRISYGPFQLGTLPSGKMKEVSGKVLKEQLGEGFSW